MSIENEMLTALIRRRLMQDSRVGAMAIDVCSCDGCVSLLGCVDTLEQKELAVQLVVGMVGVREVTDELRVRQARPVAVDAAGGAWTAV